MYTAEILAFVSIKGGVGKTTLALETASTLVNQLGKRVLLVDANFSAPNIGLHLGNINHKHDYAFVDMNVDAGIHYYRLRMVDVDGSFEHSPVIRVNSELDIRQVLAYPNPSQNFIHLRGVNPEVIRSVKFYNLEGRLVKSFNEGLETLNISDFKQGQYLIRVELIGGDVYEGKIVKD